MTGRHGPASSAADLTRTSGGFAETRRAGAATVEATHAEWTKSRSTPGTWWLLLTALLLTIALSGLAAGAVSCPATGCSQDLPSTGLTGVVIGQAVVAVLAVLAIGTEYSTGMIRTSLTAIPQRHLLLTAKAAVLSLLVLGCAVIAVSGSVGVVNLILSTNDHPTLSLTDGPTLRAAAGSVLYLVLVALLSLGVATAIRDPAVSIGAVLGLLYFFPILAALVTDPDWQRHLKQIGPMSAGLTITRTTELETLPISPWAGLGVLALWAMGSLLLAALLLRTRDA